MHARHNFSMSEDYVSMAKEARLARTVLQVIQRSQGLLVDSLWKPPREVLRGRVKKVKGQK